jgi:sterol 3beta-glucosyltransferase
MFGVMVRHVIPLAAEVSKIIAEVSQGSDLLIHAFTFTSIGPALAKHHGIPDISIQLFPIFAVTGEFPSPAFLPFFNLKIYNRLTHWLSNQGYWHFSRFSYSWIRTRLPEIDFPDKIIWPYRKNISSSSHLVFAISSQVLPHPSDWPEYARQVGYLISETPPDWQPQPDLARFLKEGPPPVYFGFGSMITRDADRIQKICIEALNRTQQRGIFQGFDTSLSKRDFPEFVYPVKSVPHNWLFPQMGVIVHHGGAGTTAASLRAGRPTNVVPFTSDQPFWARRVAALGAGPRPIPLRRLTVENLSEAIQTAVNDPEIIQNAAKIGVKLQGEDGLEEIINLVNELI